MAKVFKNIMISEETAYVGNNTVVHSVKPIMVEEPVMLDEDDRLLEWQSGYTKGLADGAEQERACLYEQANTLTALIQSIPQAIDDSRQQLSSEIADIVLLIASKFFIHQQQNKEAIAHQITQVISQLNEKHNLEIALHPDDLALIQQGDVNLDLRGCKNIRLKADEHLRLGGCIVTSEHGVFDAGIERQIDNLKHVLLQMKNNA